MTLTTKAVPQLSHTASGHDWLDQLFMAIDGRDWHALEVMLDPAVTYERPGYAPLIGMERVMQFYRHERIIQSGRHEIKGMIEGHDGLSYFGRFRGKSKTGAPLDVSFCDFCSFKDDLLHHRRTFFYVPAI